MRQDTSNLDSLDIASSEFLRVDNRGYEIWIPGSREGDGTDMNPVEEALFAKVMNVMSIEMLDRGPILYDERGFPPQTLHTRFFEFVQVNETEEGGGDRFFTILYAQDYTNSYHPRNNYWRGWHFYPMGTSDNEIVDGFREDLKNGKIPTPALHQVSVRIGPGGGSFYNRHIPCCIEVTDKVDIEEIKALVQEAVELGLRNDIIYGTREGMEEILARVENDDSLDFDYGDW